MRERRLPPAVAVSLAFVAIALLAIPFADLAVTTRTPFAELGRMLGGVAHPRWLPPAELAGSLARTLAYAVGAVTIGSIAGLTLALWFDRRPVRVLCNCLRSVHELFWGLLFIQLLGIQPLTGLLAIAIPYTGIFAKVYSEIIEESQQHAKPQLTPGSDRFSQFWYGLWPGVHPPMLSYTLYRLECGIRSSTILGFIGLPTIGFELQSAFMQGYYDEVAGLLLVLYVLIATLRWWMREALWPLYAVAALGWLLAHSTLNASLLGTLLFDMVPQPLRQGNLPGLLPWLQRYLAGQGLTGVVNTLLVTQIAVVIAGVLALLAFPLISRHFLRPAQRWLGHWLLVVVRSTPELIIAFALLLLWGPSMLPAVVALGVHNGAIVGHLTGRFSDSVALRADAARGLNRYAFEILPRVYGQFLAFACYRWEIIMRESAILGILGIHTLGFYIDSAFQRFQLDVAVLLIALTASLNMAIDASSRILRRRLHLQGHPDAVAPQPAL